VNSILYGNFRVEVMPGTGSRVDRLTAQAPPVLTLRPARAPAAGEAFLAGRARQLDLVRGAVRARRPVGFFGACGYGKTTLLRHIAAHAVADGLSSSSIYLRAGPGGLEDLLHRLVGELYTADQPVKLTPGQCAQLLTQVQALIALDDVTTDPDRVDYLLRVLPGCSLLLSSQRPVLGDHGSSQALPGLDQDAAVQLISVELGGPLSDGELTAVARLAEAVDGQPLHLRQAAALAREGRLSLAEMADLAERDPGRLDQLSIDALAGWQRRALAVLALAAGALLPAELVGVMGDIAEIGECLHLLHRRGLAEQRHDRFGLPACQAERYRGIVLRDLHHAAALRELANWLANCDPTVGDSIEAASAALTISGWAADDGDWPAVVRLVRVAEPILTLAGHWQASRSALACGLHAARAIADHASEALFSHEQGTLALCLDELSTARELLEHALQLRQQHGDHDGAAVSRHNLTVLQPPPPSRPKPRVRSWRKIPVTVGGCLLAVTALAVGVTKALTSASSPSASHPTRTHHSRDVSRTGTRRSSQTGASQGSGSGGQRQQSTGASSTGTSTGTTGGDQSPLQMPALTPLAFNPVDITPGQPTSTKTLTVRNPNSRPLPITSASIPEPFTVTADTCLAQPIAAQGSCTVTVQFAPTTLGDFTRVLSLNSPAGQSTVSLSGTGYVNLTITVTGDGSVSDGQSPSCTTPADATSTACTEPITGPVTLTPTPGPGQVFAGWESPGGDGLCEGTGSSLCEVPPLTQDSAVDASFELRIE
jgi:hypothetical protein